MSFETSYQQSYHQDILERLKVAQNKLGKGPNWQIDWLIRFIVEQGKGSECLKFLAEKIVEDLRRS